MRRHAGWFGFLALVLGAPAAGAHTMLSSPAPRVAEDGLKTGPCGPNSTRTDTPMIVAPGSTLNVQWLETVEHPGYYRLALSMANDEGFEDNVLQDQIPDEVCSAPPCNYSIDITLPDVECLDCTLQLIQFMGTAEPYSPYFSCADLMITGDPGGDGEGDGDGDASAGGGCQVGSDAGHGAAATLLLLCVVLAITRRRE